MSPSAAPDPALTVLEPGRPAARVGQHAHPVGLQKVQLAAALSGLDQFDIGVAGDQQHAEQRLAERAAGLLRIGSGKQPKRRMVGEPGGAAIDEPRHRRGGLGDQPHRAVDDRVAHIALARQRGVVGARPARLGLAVPGDQPCARRACRRLFCIA